MCFFLQCSHKQNKYTHQIETSVSSESNMLFYFVFASFVLSLNVIKGAVILSSGDKGTGSLSGDKGTGSLSTSATSHIPLLSARRLFQNRECTKGHQCLVHFPRQCIHEVYESCEAGRLRKVSLHL